MVPPAWQTIGEKKIYWKMNVELIITKLIFEGGGN